MKRNVILRTHKIPSKEHIKLLGVYLDENLNFNKQISEVCKKASQRAGVLFRLRNVILCRAKLQLYMTSILPYLMYCHVVWHLSKASDKRMLERVLECALRRV